MAYADQDGMSSSRLVSIIIVALLHAFLGYALVTGLAYEAVQQVKAKLNVVDVKEEEPPEEEPPPEPEKQIEPPVVSPPPLVTTVTPPPTVRTVDTPPPAAPIVPTAAPPAPSAPPPPPPPVDTDAVAAREIALNKALNRMTEGQTRLIDLTEARATATDDPEARMRLRSIDALLGRLVEESASARDGLISELREDMAALTRAIRNLERGDGA